jgi:hypothetical protein
MAVVPIKTEVLRDFAREGRNGLEWFYLVWFTDCFPIVSPVVSPYMNN